MWNLKKTQTQKKRLEWWLLWDAGKGEMCQRVPTSS